MQNESITLPDWAFKLAVGGNPHAKLAGATFTQLSDTERQLNCEEHGKSPNFFTEPRDILFADDDEKVVVYDHETYEITVHDSLENAIGWLPESMDHYMDYEFGTDDPLVDALHHCVEYRILSKEDCDQLIARLDAEKRLESE